MEERHPSCEIMKDFKPVQVDCDGKPVKAMTADDVIKAAEDLYKLAPKQRNPYDEIKKSADRVGYENQPELIETAEKLGVTPAKLDAMRKYAAFLRNSDRRIKEATVRKRILEKFKIKLV